MKNNTIILLSLAIIFALCYSSYALSMHHKDDLKEQAIKEEIKIQLQECQKNSNSYVKRILELEREINN
jgi:uncharacterized phage-like protein YoqJ